MCVRPVLSGMMRTSILHQVRAVFVLVSLFMFACWFVKSKYTRHIYSLGKKKKKDGSVDLLSPS